MASTSATAEIGAGANFEGSRNEGASTKAELRALVVTVSVVPLMEHVPWGIAQLAVKVGVVVKPASFIVNVNALPAEPVCEGCEIVTAGFAVNVAVTLVFAVIANVQTAFVLPGHAPPDQLANVALEFGTAVNVMDVFALNDAPDGAC
jgi:hypothetical protein